MRKKIAIVFNRMIVGGVEKALLNFLRAIDTERYDVTLFTFNDKSPHYDELPADITVRFTACDHSKAQFWNDIKHLRIKGIANGIYCRVMIRVCQDEYKKFTYSILSYPKLPGHFDCAIAYKFGWEDTAMILKKIDADKKCAWLHGSVGNDRGTRRWLNRVLPKIQHIFCVSEDCKKQLDQVCPEHRHKTQVFYNLLSAQEIIEKGKEQAEFMLRHTAIVTVGRLASEKGQTMIPKATRLLLDAGYDVFWYLVGDGDQRKTIEAEIQKYDVAEHVILLGTQMNPYPYIKNCDIYVQTSFSEGWCLTVQEARILQKPIVTTPLPVMHEQIISGENGLIAEAVTPEALFEGIRTLLDHPELQAKFVENLSHEVCDNSGELQKLYDFIES